MRLSNITLEEFEALFKNQDFWYGKITELLKEEKVDFKNLNRFSFGSNLVYSIDGKFVLKLFPSFYGDEYQRELTVLKNLKLKTVDTPSIYSIGSFEGWNFIIMTELKGVLLIDLWDTLSDNEKLLLAVDLGRLIKEVHSISPAAFGDINVNWNEFIANQKKNLTKHHTEYQLPKELMDQLSIYVGDIPSCIMENPALLTGEYTPFNLLMTRINDEWRLTGLIDFADCFIGEATYDLLGPIVFTFIKDKEIPLTKEFLMAYGFTAEELNPEIRKKLMVYLLHHRFSNIKLYLSKLKEPQKVNTLEDVEKALFWE